MIRSSPCAARLLASVIAAGSWLAISARATEPAPLQLFYFDRPPFMADDGSGRVQGVVATPVGEAFARAGIAVAWIKVPAARQLVAIQENRERACGLGWFKNPEREKFAKFSRPLYQDQQMIVLAHVNYTNPETSTSEFLADKDLRLLTKRGFSYGPLLDQRLQTMAAIRVEVAAEIDQMFSMLASRRVDAAFFSSEEADYLLASRPGEAKSLRKVVFRDLPKGEKRHLMCSPSVDDELLRRFNAALAVNL